MNKFNVEIHHENAFAPTILMMMEPGPKVMEIAEKLSLAYPGQDVTVAMFARNRRRYKDGQVITSEPDLSKFYKEVSDQDAWEWVCLGAVTD